MLAEAALFTPSRARVTVSQSTCCTAPLATYAKRTILGTNPYIQISAIAPASHATRTTVLQSLHEESIATGKICIHDSMRCVLSAYPSAASGSWEDMAVASFIHGGRDRIHLVITLHSGSGDRSGQNRGGPPLHWFVSRLRGYSKLVLVLPLLYTPVNLRPPLTPSRSPSHTHTQGRI